MSLEERTLVVRNFDDQVTKELLFELFQQAGPVVNVVLRSDHAFVEFEHSASVGYAMALLNGIALHGCPLSLEPKLRHDQSYYTYAKSMEQFNKFMQYNPEHFLQFMSEEEQRTVREQLLAEREANHRHSSHSRHRHSDGYQYSDSNRYSDNRYSDGNRYQQYDYQQQYSHNQQYQHSYQNQDRESYTGYNSRKRHSYPSW